MKKYLLGASVLIIAFVLIYAFLAKTDPVENEKQKPLLNNESVISAFREFAINPSQEKFEQVPFEEEVLLGLGDEIFEQRMKDELREVEAWKIDTEVFRAYAGPFSALELADDESVEVAVSVGPHDHCASPPVPSPSEVTDLVRVSMQPIPGENSGCLEWWTVDLFLTNDFKIRAVTLNLWEP